MSGDKPVAFDDDNPEWTQEDFARAKPIEEYPELAQAFAEARKRGRPPGSAKQQITLRLEKDVIARFRAGGPGWQSRMNEALRKAVGL